MKAIALLLWASVASADPTQCGLNDRLLTISFAHAVTDADASAFLARHQLAPSSAYLWVAGSPLTVSLAPATIDSLRSATEASRLNNRPSLAAQAAAFVAQHTRGELVRDFELAEKGKDILRQVTRDDAIVKRSKANKPLIWAISVCAPPDSIAPEEGVQISDTPIRPEQLPVRFPTPRVDLLSGAETYEQLLKLAKP